MITPEYLASGWECSPFIYGCFHKKITFDIFCLYLSHTDICAKENQLFKFFINLNKEDVEWLWLHHVHSKINSFFQSIFLLPLCNTELDILTFSPNLFPPYKLQNIKVPQFIFWGSDNKFPYTFPWATDSIFLPRTPSVSCLFLLRQ